MRCSVKAGEMLYLPSLWFHHVQQTQGCTAGGWQPPRHTHAPQSHLHRVKICLCSKDTPPQHSYLSPSVCPHSQLLVRHGVRHQVQLLPAAGVSERGRLSSGTTEDATRHPVTSLPGSYFFCDDVQTEEVDKRQVTRFRSRDHLSTQQLFTSVKHSKIEGKHF